MASRDTSETNPLKAIAKKTHQKQPTEKPSPLVQSIKLELGEPGSWKEKANCLGLGDEMFPKRHKDISYISKARKICKECEVREDCLLEALEYPTTDMHGVWAGLTPRQLLREQQRRGITPSKPTIAQIWNAISKEEQ